jgi:hydroxyacylglutathione hydrolase
MLTTALPYLSFPVSIRQITVISLLLASCPFAAVAAEHSDIIWDHLRPLSHDPALNSGVALNRPCVPGETVVLRHDLISPSPNEIDLNAGEFVVCTNNNAGQLEVVDGLARTWMLSQDAVNSTQGFPDNWIAYDRDYLVWAYSRDTIVMRESLHNTFEGNFLYLLLDLDADDNVTEAMLIDSGSGYADLAPYIDPVVGGSPLTVISTHSHWDHYGGHRHFMDHDNVTLVGYVPGNDYNAYPVPLEYPLEDLQAALGLEDWPNKNAEFAIGARTVTVIPIPGHTLDAVAIYDPKEELLFTSDTVYPGFLFIDSWPDAAKSLAKLELFAQQYTVKWVLGGHVEMSKKKPWNGMHEYFNFGTNTHWDEHSLELPVGSIAETRRVLDEWIANADGELPTYISDKLDPVFHYVPLVPIAMTGIPQYFRDSSSRLIDTLRRRAEGLEAQRTSRQTGNSR